MHRRAFSGAASFAVFAAALTIACERAGPAKSERPDRIEGGIAVLQPCSVGDVDASEWRTIDARFAPLRLRLPAPVRPVAHSDPNASGEAWVSGRLAVSYKVSENIEDVISPEEAKQWECYLERSDGPAPVGGAYTAPRDSGGQTVFALIMLPDNRPAKVRLQSPDTADKARMLVILNGVEVR